METPYLYITHITERTCMSGIGQKGRRRAGDIVSWDILHLRFGILTSVGQDVVDDKELSVRKCGFAKLRQDSFTNDIRVVVHDHAHHEYLSVSHRLVLEEVMH